MQIIEFNFLNCSIGKCEINSNSFFKVFHKICAMCAKSYTFSHANPVLISKFASGNEANTLMIPIVSRVIRRAVTLHTFIRMLRAFLGFDCDWCFIFRLFKFVRQQNNEIMCVRIRLQTLEIIRWQKFKIRQLR